MADTQGPRPPIPPGGERGETEANSQIDRNDDLTPPDSDKS